MQEILARRWRLSDDSYSYIHALVEIDESGAVILQNDFVAPPYPTIRLTRTMALDLARLIHGQVEPPQPSQPKIDEAAKPKR